MHSLSSINAPHRPTARRGRAARYGLAALLCAAVFAAGCHHRNINSGYGIVWATLSDSPGDFTTYTVTVDSLTLTRSDGAVVTVFSANTPELVDFVKLGNIAELYGSGTIPVGTYTQATLTLDYSHAVIGVMVNGAPQKATVVDSTGKPITTTQSVNVVLDPATPFTVVPTYATTSAQRLAIDLNLAASTVSVNQSTSPATVTVRPYVTASLAPADNKPIRIRGPLINSSLGLGTFTVYVRPFYDIVDSFGSLSVFVDANTIYNNNGVVSQGLPGLTQLSRSSAGTTMTSSYATFEPTATPAATAGIFHVKYVVAGSSLEDNYTQGIEGDVIARSGNTLTLRGSTLQLNGVTNVNTGVSYYFNDSTVTISPATTVTADNSTVTGLTAGAVAVGQHIAARGVYSVPATDFVSLDATSSRGPNTGSVRLINTPLWGTVVSSGAGALTMNLQTISNWPVTSFAFAGNGTSAAADPVATAYDVNTGTLAVPTLNAGDPVWVNGLVAPFGAAPPDFTASAVNDELGVQTVGAAAGGLTCAQGVFNCVPASLRVSWTGAGTTAPFSDLSSAGMTIDLNNAALSSAVIRIGPESIDLKASGLSPQIVPQTGTGTTGLPAVFTPLFTYGNPLALPAAGSTTPVGISAFSSFATFLSGLPAAITAAPALQFEARGTYNRTTNTFNAISVDVVL